ncbi:protein kinase [Nocardia nova]|uniref:WD40 repeat domain-containing serine/threonine protein kinase n=1 Tax=Nocardia nova TaxID=37330 RepID=UPI003799BAC3
MNRDDGVETAHDQGAGTSAEDVPIAWHPGDVVVDLYEVHDVIRSGGMGVVYRVRHRGWDVELAAKAPREELLNSAARVRDFEAEAQAWVELGLHPNVVSCVYVRRLGGVPRVFAEWVNGGSLADAVRDRSLYTGTPEQVLARVLDVAIQFARGLGHAHAKRLIHQDVKPANVMRTADGIVKVTDFGLAKARNVAGESAGGQPGTSVLAGFGGMTPAYCSPEQARAAAAVAAGDRPEPLTRATDIWSWAVSVWELFAGEPPCRHGQVAAEQFESYLTAGRSDPALPPLPSQVATILRRCFAADPTRRLRIGEVTAALIETYAALIGTSYPRPQPDAVELLADGLSNHALSLLDLGRTEAAVGLWHKALQADPQNPHAVYNYGLHRWRAAAITDDQLIAQLEAVQAAHPGEAIGSRLLGLVHLERGDRATARDLLRKANEQNREDVALGTEPTIIDHADPIRPVVLAGRAGAVALGPGVAATAGAGSVQIWDSATGRCLHRLDGTQQRRYYSVDAVAISADGRIAIGRQEAATLRVLDLATGCSLHTLQRTTGDSVAISSDGTRAVSGGGGNGCVQVWDLVAGRAMHILGDRGFEIVSITSNGRCALAWDDTDGRVRVWDVESGRLLRTSAGHARVVLSADGESAISARDDGSTELWNVATGLVQRAIPLDPGWRSQWSAAAITTDGELAVAADTANTRNVVRIYQLATGRCLRTMAGHTEPIRSLAIRGELAISGGSDGARIWRVAPAGPPAAWSFAKPRTATELGADARLVATALSSADRLLVERNSNTVVELLRSARAVPGHERNAELLHRWRRAATGAPRGRLLGAWEVYRIADTRVRWRGIRTDDRLLLVDRGEVRDVFELGTGKHVHAIPGREKSAFGSFVAQGILRFVADSDALRLWDVSTGRCVRSFVDQRTATMSLSVSLDGTTLCSVGVDKKVRIWDVHSGRCLRELHHGIGLRAAALSGDGRRVMTVGVLKPTLRIWDVGTGRCLTTASPQYGNGREQRNTPDLAPVVGSDGRTALFAAGNAVRIWDLHTGKPRASLIGHSDTVNAIVPSADGELAVTGSDDSSVRVWNLKKGRCLHTLTGHAGPVTDLAVSADCRFAVSAGLDGRLNIWDLRTGHRVGCLEGHTKAVHSVALDTIGRTVISSALDHTVRIWELDWDIDIAPTAPGEISNSDQSGSSRRFRWRRT